MLDAFEFILILAVFAAVLHWYLKNAGAASDGLLGLLALKPDPEGAGETGRKSYRSKRRARDKTARLHDSRNGQETTKTYRTLDEGERMRRRYRKQDEARYRIKDKAARYAPAKTDT